MKLVAQIILIGSSVTALAQNRTMQPREENERPSASSHRALLIPFEPKLYLGELDQKFHAESNLSYAALRNKFRDGVNQQLYRALKSEKFGVLDLMDDSVKYKKDLEEIYHHLTYEYQKVPDQEKYSPPKTEKEEKKVQKGQLTVETRGDRRFMNAKLKDAQLVPGLHNKFGTNVFIFVNELDIRSSMHTEPGETGAGTPTRKIVVHYTVFSHEGKEINSGIAEEEFDTELNNPSKIIDRHFSKIATVIAQRIGKGLGLNKKK
jgi:hypothetical protein